MTASILPNALCQFIDINGAPLVDGTVAFYVPTTLTPKDTWQDPTQLILNTNPVVLDSRGQALIYGVGPYRQIVKDSAGNTIWDQLTGTDIAGTFGTQATIASATTTDLGSLSSTNVLVTGTTTINSFGTSATLSNPVYLVQFNGSLTLTNNNTSLILKGAVNRTTRANDIGLYEFINALGYWREVAYFRANGQTASITGTDTGIASNTTTDLGSLAGNLATITGTTTITSLGSSASTGNPVYFVKFASALTLTYNASSLILPGAADITTATNDAAIFEYLGSGNWQCLIYQGISGGALIKVDTYSTSGTYTWTKDARCRSIIVEVVGGGASGGGTTVTTSGHMMAGSGGGAGAYTKGQITSPSATYTETEVAGGATTVGASNGNAGGASSLGAALVCAGGTAGVAGSDISSRSEIVRGTPAGGLVTTAGNILSIKGSSGGPSWAQIDSGVGLAIGGYGGAGPFGGNASGGVTSTAGTGSAGDAANGPGCGGAGGAAWAAGSATPGNGGAGHDGIVIVYSYS